MKDGAERLREDPVEQDPEEVHDWQATFDAVGAVIWVLDPDQRIVRCNRATRTLLGRRPSEVLGQHCWSVVHGTSCPIPECPILRMRQTLRRESMELQVGDRWFEVVVDPILGGDGEYKGAVHILSDMTARKRAEAELRRLCEQTQQDASTKTELLQEVNHRVKNNLISILGLIRTEQLHAAKSRADVSEGSSLENLRLRIQGLIEVHHMLSETHWQPMRLSELARRILTAVASTAEPSKQVVLDIAESPILVSPRQANSLALSLNELATNTLKYAAVRRMMTCITVRVQTQGDFIALEYRDDGPGYPAEILNGQREGVGLVLLKQLASGAFRGSVTLTNDPGAVAHLIIRAEDVQRT